MTEEIKPFNNCPALDGYHCQSNALAKIYHYNNCKLSEDMLLGLGAGMGFIYCLQHRYLPSNICVNMCGRKLDLVVLATLSGNKKRQLTLDLPAKCEGSCRSTPDYVVVSNRGEVG